jgi:uncharacterized protein with PIN domain
MWENREKDGKRQKMKKSKKELKAEFLEEAGDLFDELTEWDDQTAEITLGQLEEMVLKMRKQLGEQMLEAVVKRQENRQPAEKQRCAGCGEEMIDKGQKGNQVESLAGRIQLERSYYYCPKCKQGVFPPGSANEDLGEELE